MVDADIIPQGQKAVSYCAGVSNVGDFSDYVLFTYEQPQNPSIAGVFSTIADATCKSLTFPTTFYALKRADYSQGIFPSDRSAQRSFLEADPRVIRGVTATPTRFVDQSDLATAITATYRIASLTESGLAMQLVSENRAPGESVAAKNRAVTFAWFALLPLAALIAIVVVLLVRRRRRGA
jgi:hypothetical protein